MTLYILRWALSVVFALSFMSGGACESTSSSVRYQNLQRSLYNVIPVCATCCVNKFVRTEYAPGTCSNWDDIQCLCRTHTTSGFTLGEGALRCVISTCPKEVVLSSKVYNICDSVPGALPRTHPVITATVMSVISIPATASQTTTSFASSTTCTFTTRIATSRTLSAWSVSANSQTTSSSNTSTPSMKQTSMSTAVPAAGGMSRLNKPALIGVSVASGVAAAFIMGVALFFCCSKLRRKRREERERNTFEIGGEMSEPPNFRLAAAPIPAGPDGTEPSGAVFNDQGIRGMKTPFGSSHYRNPMLLVTRPDAIGSSAARTAEIGIAVSPEFDSVDSPESQTSQRTLSQLLPDKPTYDLHPQPLRWSRDTHSRPASGETLFEEDVGERPRSVLGASNGYTTMPAGLGLNQFNNSSLNKPLLVGLPPHPRANMYRVEGGWVTPPVARSPGQQTDAKSMDDTGGPPRTREQHPQFQLGGSGNPQVQGSDSFDQYWQSSLAYGGRKASSTAHPLLLSDGNANQHPYGPIPRLLLPRGPVTGHAMGFEERPVHRFSGNLQSLLTPVKEAITPSPNDTPNEYFDANPAMAKYSPPLPRSMSASPSAEIVTRPRIVKGEEIRQIRVKGAQSSQSPSDVSQTQTTPWKRPVKRISPSERKLTPSRRGGDLILSVDSV